MALIQANGIEIYYDITGDETAPPVLLISGVGTQSTRWPDGFVARLAARGYRVIRMDNRDIGLSQKFSEHGAPDFSEIVAQKQAGERPEVPYALSDMAADAAGLLDALGIDRAHIVGASMGGMIAQLVAIEHSGKCLSLTSIYSNTGNPALPGGVPEVRKALTAPRPDPEEDRAGYIAANLELSKLIGSPGYPIPDADIVASIEADLDRSYHPTGFTRQYAAILAAPDRRPGLQGLTLPVTVIHGIDDPLVPVEGGRDTAANCPTAELIEIEGMGHNMPPALYERLIDGIETATQRA